jgi:hypothetical protein
MAAGWRYLGRLATILVLRHIYGMRIGRRCHVASGLRYAYPQHVTVDDGVVVARDVALWSETSDGRLHLGTGSQVSRGTKLDFSGGLTVGAEALISEEVLIYTHDHGYDPRSQPRSSPLCIGRGAWVGARAVVLPCVTHIGEGAVVGAGAIVTRNVPDNHVYVAGTGRLMPRKEIA